MSAFGPDTAPWPEQAAALDAGRLAPALAESLGITPRSAALARPEATLLKETGVRRCVIRYRIGEARVLGKLYQDTARGERTHGRLLALRRCLDAGHRRCVPKPFAWLPELGLLLQEWRDGSDLRGGLSAEHALQAGARAARWLAALHSAPALPALKQRTLDYEMQRLDRFAERIVAGTGAPPPALREALDGLSAGAARLPSYLPTMIHKDFYHAHVLWDGAQLSILDFDELSIGDPAFDVGHFVTHLERYAQIRPTRARILRAVSQCFLDAYPAAQDDGFQARVAFYRGYTALKLAATEARRARPGWQRQADLLLARATTQTRWLASRRV